MRNYEFTVIFDANDEKMKEGLAFVTDSLAKAGAQITKQDDLGIHYVYFELSADPASIAKLSHSFQLSTLVLKFLFVNPEK